MLFLNRYLTIMIEHPRPIALTLSNHAFTLLLSLVDIVIKTRQNPDQSDKCAPCVAVSHYINNFASQLFQKNLTAQRAKLLGRDRGEVVI